jgi:CBS domain-containing protein
MLMAADVMTPDVITVTPDTSVREIAKLLYTRHISGVPVIDREKRVIGIVGEGDLLGHAEVAGERRRTWWLDAFVNSNALARDYIKTHGRVAADVMTPTVITVAPTALIAEIAKILERHRIKRVPVIDGGKLVGIVTRGDLLQALAAAEVARPASVDDRAIRERLLAELETQRWAHLLTKNIVVQNGVIHLSGFVETLEERHALHIAAENVPGVERVEDHCRARPLFRMQ